MLAIILALGVLYAWWAPASWFGRFVRGQVEAFCRRLSRTRSSTIVFSLICVAALALFLAYARSEGLAVAAQASAEARAWFAVVDVGTCVEALAAAWLLGPGGSGLRAMSRGLRAVRAVRVRWNGSHGRRRAPRVRGMRRPRGGMGDDDEPWGSQTAILAC